MVELESTQKEVKIVRFFEGIEAYETGKSLRVTYKEQTIIDGQVIKEENKSYQRDYEFWKASEIGQAIIGIVSLDLAQQDPSAPRSTPTE